MQTVTSRNTNVILFLIIIMLFSAISMVAANTTFMVTNEIYQGVTVGDIHVGGLSVTQAQEKIASIFKERTTNEPVITAVYKDQKWAIFAKDIDLIIQPDKLAQQAYDVGRNGNIIYRLKERYLAVNKGQSLPLTVQYNQEKIRDILDNITKNIDLPPINARLKPTGNSVEIVPEMIGRKVDKTKTMTNATALLNEKITFTFNIVVEELIPSIITRDLAHIDGLIASYTTLFDPWDQNRTENVLLAARSINDVLVKKDEVFSFNDIVGLRLARFGYKEAPVYLNGILVPDWGGGVCQVSSTLYNAALLADLLIEERTPHFRPPGYVPLGQDATVADNQLDFKFKNILHQNIYIISEVLDNKLVVNIFGKRKENPAEIYVISTDKKVLEPNTTIKQDHNLELGKEIVEIEGQKGFLVSTYRVKKVDGKIVKKEFLAADEFRPVDRIVRVGTKVLSQQPKK